MPVHKIHLLYTVLFTFFIIITSCSVQKKLAGSANNLLKDPAIVNAHTGISIFEPATQKYWYDYQADKYFIPASNTKIPTCYAAMKYLGDSLPAIRYYENDTALFLIPCGDPTLLHPDFKEQPFIDFCKQRNKKIFITDTNWMDFPFGSGWSWDDYNDSYAAERSPLPVYGNVIKWIQTQTLEKPDGINEQLVPSVFSEPEVNWDVNFDTQSRDSVFSVRRSPDSNSYIIYQGKEKYLEQDVPFITHGLRTALDLLRDTIGKDIGINRGIPFTNELRTLYSRPVDSLLRPLMYHSDNFFAEQVLLMVSNKLTGTMNDEKIIDTLLKSDFNDLPQKPRWVDGSGLSRYNLFSPRDFVTILNKMKTEFGMKRIQVIFPTGGSGTMQHYFKNDSSYIYAKTGSLSGVVALSGYLYTRKGKLLIFSIIINNHQTSPGAIRTAIENFLRNLRNRY